MSKGADRGRKICRHLAGRVVVGRQHDRRAVDTIEEAKRERFVGNPVLKAEYRLVQHSRSLEPQERTGRVRTFHRQKDDIVSLEGDFLGTGADRKLRRPHGLRCEKPQPRASHGFELPAAGNANDRVSGKGQLRSDDATDCAQPIDDDPHSTPSDNRPRKRPIYARRRTKPKPRQTCRGLLITRGENHLLARRWVWDGATPGCRPRRVPRPAQRGRLFLHSAAA